MKWIFTGPLHQFLKYKILTFISFRITFYKSTQLSYYTPCIIHDSHCENINARMYEKKFVNRYRFGEEHFLLRTYVYINLALAVYSLESQDIPITYGHICLCLFSFCLFLLYLIIILYDMSCVQPLTMIVILSICYTLYNRMQHFNVNI